MQNNDPQSTDIKDYVTPAKPHGEKVIQPSAALIEEMKQEQAAAAAAPTPPVAPTAAQAPPSTAAAPLPSTPPSSVYPDVTKGIGADVPAPSPQDEPVPGPNLAQGATSKLVAIKVVAGVMVFGNLYNAYHWLIGGHAGIYNWIDLLVIVLSLVLALGLFSLKETARSIYVIIAAISLVLMCFGIVALFVTSSHLALQSALSLRVLLSYAMYIVTGLFPLVFFTRPAIKAEFN